MSAEKAWQEWLNSPEQEFKANHDRASFMAGYRRALEDAANAIRAKERGVDDYGAHYTVDAAWLAARAAAADPRETKD